MREGEDCTCGKRVGGLEKRIPKGKETSYVNGKVRLYPLEHS